MASYSNGVLGGLNRLLASAVVAGVFFVLPPAALACSGGVSAVNVYKECVQTGGGSKPTSGTQTSSGSTTVHLSKKTAIALKKAGTNGKSLRHLVGIFGAPRVLQSSSVPGSEPTAVGSAFDLGSGPTALLIVLAGTAVLLLAASGFRAVRQRRD